MRTSRLVAALCGGLSAVCLCGCRSASAGQAKLDADRSLGKSVTYRNLSLSPVFDRKAGAKDVYSTLEEGLKARHVTVAESPAGGEVNRLLITNKGPKPVYIIAGEVVLGGQQDRCVGKDTIIPPGKRPIPVTVYCVEHGRWAGAERFDASAKMVAGLSIRASAQDGAVASNRPEITTGRAASGRQLAAQSMGVARSRVAESQSRVWQEVASKNQRFGASPSSGTYRDVLQGVGGSSGTATEPYVRALEQALPKDGQLVGIVAAIDGKVVAADIFGDAPLFRKLWPKLLRSYAADAAEAAGGKTAAGRPITSEAARAWILAARSGRNKTTDRSADSSITRLESGGVVLYRSAAPGALGGAMGGKAMHENYLRK
jgi:hypothetical protein